MGDCRESPRMFKGMVRMAMAANLNHRCQYFRAEYLKKSHCYPFFKQAGAAYIPYRKGGGFFVNRGKERRGSIKALHLITQSLVLMFSTLRLKSDCVKRGFYFLRYLIVFGGIKVSRVVRQGVKEKLSQRYAQEAMSSQLLTDLTSYLLWAKGGVSFSKKKLVLTIPSILPSDQLRRFLLHSNSSRVLCSLSRGVNVA